ncbi:hypothetical protein OS121_29090 [Mycolicibacterium mucogenicum]|nr:hypothetical protein [Mycolicibacterium mucogenicum]MCX8559102.1 hypothetical protein [Mycolicibacterium mucogenicum]
MADSDSVWPSLAALDTADEIGEVAADATDAAVGRQTVGARLPQVSS